MYTRHDAEEYLNTFYVIYFNLIYPQKKKALIMYVHAIHNAQQLNYIHAKITIIIIIIMNVIIYK